MHACTAAHLGLAVHKLGFDISGGQGALVIFHEQARDLAHLARGLEDGGVLEHEERSARCTSAGAGQADLGHSGLVNTLDELQAGGLTDEVLAAHRPRHWARSAEGWGHRPGGQACGAAELLHF